MPDLVKVAREARNKDVEVLLVSYDLQVPKVDRTQVGERVRKFVAGRRWGLPVLIYGASGLDELNERLDLPGHIPVTLAFDKDGREVDRCEGEAGKERFDELFRSALGI